MDERSRGPEIPAPVPAAATPAKAPPTAPAVRVLVADDEVHIRHFLKGLLSRPWYLRAHVEEAASAEEALSRLQAAPYHVLITDFHMDGLTGIDLLEEACAWYPRMARILMTGAPNSEMAVEAVERGAVHGFMTKPFNSQNLLVLVESLLEPSALELPPSTPPLPSRATPNPSPPSPKPSAAREAPPSAPPAQVPAKAAVKSAPVARPPAPPALARTPPAKGWAIPPITPPPVREPPKAPAKVTFASASEARQEIARIDQALRQLRVRYGLDQMSYGAYEQVSKCLAYHKADIEVWLLRKGEAPPSAPSGSPALEAHPLGPGR